MAATSLSPPTPDLPCHDGLVLGYPPMDEVHAEFVALVAELQACAPASMLDAMRALECHCRAHFAAEETWMIDSDFPRRGCHEGEHAAVLASVGGVMRRVEGGDFDAGRRLATALADWFPGHADYLDSALAHWMCKRQWGGKPIVLRRDLRACAGSEATIDHRSEMT